jgi:outer membrane receptor protein involved in Fe transport
LVSFSAYAISGRPKNARGNCPVDIDPDAYEQYCFFAFGEPSPRASAGRLPWLYNIDMGLRYTPSFYDRLTLGVDVFNILDFHKETRIQEAIQQAGDETAPADPSYGAAVYYQEPRYFRFSARWMFK